MNYHPIDHFLAISYMYFLMTKKTSASVTDEELQDLIIAINEGQFTGSGAEQYLG